MSPQEDKATLTFHADPSETYPAQTDAMGRCMLCGIQFVFGPIEHVVEMNDGADVFGVCPECPNLEPAELRRRMLAYARLLRGMADELEALAG